MGKLVVDRRVQRTRQLLQEALIALILEKGYETVTVQDLIDRANVGRSTIHTHFRDKEELFLSGFESLWSQFEQHLVKQAVPLGNTSELVPPEVLAHHLVSSFLALLTWWLDNNLPYSAERMNDWIAQQLSKCLLHRDITTFPMTELKPLSATASRA